MDMAVEGEGGAKSHRRGYGFGGVILFYSVPCHSFYRHDFSATQRKVLFFSLILP
jgi:hypothetical protein